MTEPDESFEFDGFFPFIAAQAWVVLAKPSPNASAIYQFVCAHLNLTTGKVEGHPSRKTIAEHFGRSTDWVDKGVKELVQLGAVVKIYEYWDRVAKERTRKAVRDDGVKNEQTSNVYRVKLKPPNGDAYRGPISIAEYYKPDLIARRLRSVDDQDPVAETAGQTPAATQRPPVDQANVDNSNPDQNHPASPDQQEHVKPQVRPQPPHSGPPSRPATAPPAAPQRPKLEEEEREESKHHHGAPNDDASPNDDDVSAFWKTLKPVVAVDGPGRRSVDAPVRTALAGVWTPASLAEWVHGRIERANGSVRNRAGFAVTQLRDIPAEPPKAPGPTWSARSAISACTMCDESGYVNDPLDPAAPIRRCTHDQGGPWSGDGPYRPFRNYADQSVYDQPMA